MPNGLVDHEQSRQGRIAIRSPISSASKIRSQTSKKTWTYASYGSQPFGLCQVTRKMEYRTGAFSDESKSTMSSHQDRNPVLEVEKDRTPGNSPDLNPIEN
ncbi:unnamed protein product [Clavelina lepadiformis]|uniref:Uncharacterized protein n=1 Tax=Clavelina lepadiformis TaxID=159417 RepID=A0ABP0G389_CLALP